MQVTQDTKVILVVDDCAEIRDLLTQFLRGDGFVVIPVPDGASALVLAEKLHLDLMLLDLMLEDGNAINIIPDLKQRLPTTPLVIVSGYLSTETEKRCRDLGADDVVSKPINLKDLQATIFRLLRLRIPKLAKSGPEDVGAPDRHPEPGSEGRGYMKKGAARMATENGAGYLCIVARDKPALYRSMKEHLSGQKEVDILLDRRQSERRQLGRPERRRQQVVEDQLRSIGFAISRRYEEGSGFGGVEPGPSASLLDPARARIAGT